LRPVWKDFTDKLGPALRWLRAHVGERWDDVYAEIMSRFDTRTLPGRHIVFGHLIPFVEQHTFHVDAAGILREAERLRFRSTFVEQQRDDRKARDLAGRRRVAARGSAWFWFVPTFAEGMPTGRCRQDRRLTESEAREWTALMPQVRDAFSPR
jgi:hypothetical protein